MAKFSRKDRFIKALGGEQNLPSKLTTAATALQTTDQKRDENIPSKEDPFSQLQSVEVALQETSKGEDWWNAKPHIPRSAPQTQSQAQPALGSYTSEYETHFEFDPRKGEPAPLGISFSPFIAVAKFCYKFVKRELQQQLATAFFDEGKIWNREWDLYYIWSDWYETAKPVTFIPEYQLLALVDEINQHFPEANITITDELREEGLVINFDEDRSELRPRFLGHSTSRAQIEYWTTQLPFPPRITGTMPVDDRDLASWKAKMELTQEIAKNNSKAAKKKRQETVIKCQGMVRSLLRAQRYLGMAPKSDDSQVPDMSKLSLSSLDVTQAAAYDFDTDVIYISVDVEAWERPPHPITEVGVATLDTRDLQGHAPGTNGEGWQKCIRARHFRIEEYSGSSYTNKQFLSGCPDKFEFGTSEILKTTGITKAIASCFKEPFSGPDASVTSGEKRNIVLVGHDINHDITYLKKLGFSVANYSNIIDTMDTAAMYRAYTHDPNARSLGRILYEFGLEAWHVHNAGNDAVYTLWAMLAICTKAASERGSDEAAQKHADNMEKSTDVAIEQAKERFKDESEGWDSTGADGGVAVPPVELNRTPCKKANGWGNRQLYTIGGAILDV